MSALNREQVQKQNNYFRDKKVETELQGGAIGRGQDQKVAAGERVRGAAEDRRGEGGRAGRGRARVLAARHAQQRDSEEHHPGKEEARRQL